MWEERMWLLDEISKAFSSKFSPPINILVKVKHLSEEDESSSIYPIMVKLVDYDIGEFVIDDIIFSIPTSQERGKLK